MKKLHLTVFSLAFLLCACSSRAPIPSVLIAAGGNHTCALSETGGVRCWGSNAAGQLGNGSLTSSHLPMDVNMPENDIVALTAGGRHTCALSRQGLVWCWGSNQNGQLGNGTLADSPVPVQVSGLGNDITAIAAGSQHTCALSAQGRAWCWGSNVFGQLGNKTKKDSALPVEVSGLDSAVTALAAGDGHSCALTTNGAVKCWGANTFGQLGNRTKKNGLAPVDVNGLGSGMVAIAAGGAHTCALSGAGAVQCWGWDGNETVNHYALKPENVAGLQSGVAAIATGAEHTCALATDGTVWCWGSNYVGQLGRETLPASSIPVQVNGLGSGGLSLAAGGYHTCVLGANMEVECWGQNDQGELGDANRLYSAALVRVPGLKTVAFVSTLATPAPTPTNAPPTLIPWPLPTTLPTPQPGQPVTLTWLHMLNAGTGWGIDTEGRILHTTDGGNTWRCATPPAGAYDEASFFPADANNAWAAYMPVTSGSAGCNQATNCHLAASIWHTSDGGTSWQPTETWQGAAPLSRPVHDDVTEGPFSASAHGLYFLDPATGWFLVEDWGADTNILTVLARTSDGGKSLREIWRDEGFSRYTGVAFLNKMVGYLGLDETTFFERLSGMPALKDYIAGTETPYLMKTSDGGRTWETAHLPKLDPIPSGLQALAGSDERMLCGVKKLTAIPPQGILAEVTCQVTGGFGSFAFDYLSSDGGSSWHSWVASGNERFLNASMGWRLAQPGQFQQTANGGVNWVTLKMLPWQDAHFDFISEQRGWALASNGGATNLISTTDGGHHWTELWPVLANQ